MSLLLRTVRNIPSVARNQQSLVAFQRLGGVRGMADGDKKESAMEKDFVAKQERDALRRMVAKMEQQADPGQTKALAALEKQLKASGVKVDEKLKQELLEWRNKAH